jgi:cobalamin synthase
MNEMRKFQNHVESFLIEYLPIIGVVLGLAAAALYVYFVQIPNLHECMNHGLSARFCFFNVQ